MSDETAHYMESTSRLRAENEELRRGKEAWRERVLPAEHERDRLRAENEELHEQLVSLKMERDRAVRAMSKCAERGTAQHERAEAAEATMREVAEVLRQLTSAEAHRLADRLDPPPVAEKPLHAYFPSDVDAGSRSPCVHCGQAYDAHVPPPVVENPPA